MKYPPDFPPADSIVSLTYQQLWKAFVRSFWFARSTCDAPILEAKDRIPVREAIFFGARYQFIYLMEQLGIPCKLQAMTNEEMDLFLDSL